MSSVSVVIATYGTWEWKTMANERAYQSILQQGADHQCILHHEFDGTRATSLNNGVARSTGNWLLLLDADDEFAPGYVGAMRRALERHNSDGTRVLFTPAVQTIRKGRPSPPTFYKEVDLSGGNWLVIGTMISRDLFNEIGGFREHPHGLEDWNLWMRAHYAGATVVKVQDAVYRQFWNPQSEHHRFQRNRRAYMAAYEIAKADR